MTITEQITRAKTDLDRAYEAGKAEGIGQGGVDVSHLNDELEQILYGTDTGGKSFYDEFWDKYQDNGVPKTYMYAFAGYGWTDELFKPKYDIYMNNSSNIYVFQYSRITDIAESLRRCGVVLNTSRATSLVGLFVYAATETIPVIDASNSTSMAYLCQECKNLKTFEKLILSTKSNANYTSAFSRCTSLENLTLEGTLSQNGFDLKDCTKLSKASIYSVINALSSTTSGLTVTLSQTAVDDAFYDEVPDEVGSQSTEWLNLVDTKPNWTISLA